MNMTNDHPFLEVTRNARINDGVKQMEGYLLEMGAEEFRFQEQSTQEEYVYDVSYYRFFYNPSNCTWYIKLDNSGKSNYLGIKRRRTKGKGGNVPTVTKSLLDSGVSRVRNIFSF